MTELEKLLQVKTELEKKIAAARLKEEEEAKFQEKIEPARDNLIWALIDYLEILFDEEVSDDCIEDIEAALINSERDLAKVKVILNKKK